MPERTRSWVWQALLLVVAVWFFHESLWGGCSLVPTDVLHHLMLPYSSAAKQVKVQNHYTMDALTTEFPNGLFWQQSLRTGELPLWNPFILGGQPNLADNWTAVLSPFKLPYLLLPAERAFTLGIVLEFALAGWFMFALLREVGRSRPASFLGGCAWMLNSAFLLWYWRAPNLFCWAPLVLLLMERSARQDNWRYAVGAGLIFGVAQLSGNIQASAHLGFLCASYGFCMVWWHDPRRRGRALARVALVLGTGVLLAAVQWFPTLELMARDAYGGTQARGAWASLRHTALGIPALITFVIPALTGSTESYDLLKLANASRMDFTGYIGLVPFTLFLIGALVCWREWRVRGAVLTIAAVFGIVFLTPFVKYLYHRFFIVAVFAMVLIAAYGTDAVLAPEAATDSKVRRVWFWMCVFCGVVALGVLAVQGAVYLCGDRLMSAAQHYVAGEAQSYAFAYRSDWFAERIREFFRHYRLANVEFWLPLAAVPCAAAAWWTFRRGRILQPAMAAVLLALTVADLGVLGHRLVPQCDLNQYPLQPTTAILKPLEGERGLFRIHQWGPNASYIFRPNWLMIYGLQNLWGNFSLAPETVERLPFYTNGEFNAVLDLANVKYLVTDSSFSLPTNRFDLVTETGGLRLYRNPHCLPRLQFYGQWQVVPDRRRMLDLMTADSFNPQETVFLEQAPALTTSPSKASAAIEVERYTANRVIARVTAARAGVLLLADTWYPGWKAYVDGHPAPLLRADHALRATEVPAGTHVVEFRFAPASIIIGGAISIGTASLALLWMLVGHCRGLRHNT